MIGVAVLGSTGTIGDSTLDVLARHPADFRVVALGAGRDVGKLADQCRRFRPDYAALADPDRALQLERELRAAGLTTRVLAGEQGIEALACLPEAPYVMAGIVGAAGLRSTLAAARAGQRLMIANKESLVMAGPLLIAAARAAGATLLPIDSEHNGLFQCLPNGEADPAHGVDRLWLTASGGPFLRWSAEQIAAATVEQAVAHPNWQMGRKISVDSATLMNKGLEVIEAQRLFDVGPERIGVLVHPQSIVHALVEYGDGSFLAHLGAPDMRTPIAYALGWPDRIETEVARLDLAALGSLDFCAVDAGRFPAINLARQALEAGPAGTTVLNCANESAVSAFIAGHCGFLDISLLVGDVLSRFLSGNLAGTACETLEEIGQLDRYARFLAEEWLKRSPGGGAEGRALG
ncbi:MAG: 1-deoxy-D-xylulose-5-phosphate reductoisomerase [Hyphomonas sp.]|nr:1-deoxy-D-xylulose-5-phosphate reductoisomerase [Hyphomonas sp.]